MSLLLSQVRQVFSLRSMWISMALIVGAVAATATLGAKAEMLSGPADVSYLVMGGDFAMLIMFFGASLAGAAEISAKSASWFYLSNNNRIGQACLRAVIITAGMMAAGVVGMACGMLGMAAMGHPLDTSTVHNPEQSHYLWTALACWAFFSLFAALFAQALGSGVAAAGILLADVFVVELLIANMGQGWLKTVGLYLPMGNTHVLFEGIPPVIDHTPTQAAITLVITLGLAAIGCAVAVQRRAIR
ncbi:hypothetical protein ACUY3K_08595 [Corynebacterium uberis]|uniref:hypothetical protein n=1 Tax=Corynebacterium TaxID=1716 RepID=UPI001D0B081E|nr:MULTISPECIES: hypothetical protein [Corynebacterium]MCZ9308442.1 hypothetical protein [Corynebacterium sp. c6VSa_13]UDL74107.1 hypothetical protein LH391_02460 [Corynebacterium uberis]UDL75009.1 hypothetical protein LH393_06950 [Corynebacterium uberis]UDL77224.1 hypothetical protein LH394_06935 [Corynebacterium uberis]UDL79506.1 hypothetical protein LH392_07355 [Corynebacterium uberis]